MLLTAALYAGCLFVGVVVMLEIGRTAGARRAPEARTIGAVESAIFALLGLLIAFSFSRAAGQFDDRRKLIIEEANAIGTAWLRIDLLPAADQPPIRAEFREYLDLRLATYERTDDRAATKAMIAKSAAVQQQLWDRAVPAARSTGEPATMTLVLSALNSMFDIASARIAITRLHLPNVVFGMIGILVLVCSFLAGYATTERNVIRSVAWAVMVSATVYVILDLEFPRLGLIRIDDFDRVLIDLRRTIATR